MKDQDKDIFLKLRIRRILWAQGYYCPIEVDISDFAYQDAGQPLKRTSYTDIDVVGIRFEFDLRQSTVVADCKSGKESDSNRIFWLKGLMDFFEAQSGILVKTKVHSNARALAPKLGIRVLDETGLTILEKALGFNGTPVGTGELNLHTKATSIWGINVRAGDKPTAEQMLLKSVYHFLQYKYWMVPHHRNIMTIMHRFSQIKDLIDPKELKAKYLAYVGLQRLTLSILKMASDIAARDLSDIRLQSRYFLFGGAFQLQEREQMIRLLNEIIAKDEPKETIKLEPPFYDELIEIVNRLIYNSSDAAQILQHLDIVILNVLGAKQDIQLALDKYYRTNSIVLTKRIADMFSKYTGIHGQTFNELMEL